MIGWYVVLAVVAVGLAMGLGRLLPHSPSTRTTRRIAIASTAVFAVFWFSVASGGALVTWPGLTLFYGLLTTAMLAWLLILGRVLRRWSGKTP